MHRRAPFNTPRAAHAPCAIRYPPRDAYTDLYPTVTALRESGLSLQRIADRLNEDGQTTRRGSQWSPMTVERVLAMASAA